MRSIRRPSIVGCFTVLLVLASIACRDPYPGPRYRGAGATQPRRGGTFRVATFTDLRSLDPHVAYDETSGEGVHLLFDTLVDYEPGTARLVPSLAERWTVSPDGRTFTFQLRPDVRFHNGRLLVADDVRRSFERMLDPARIPCPGTTFYHLIEGFDDFQNHARSTLRGITVVDAHTVQFTLSEPDQTFLSALALPFAAPVPVELADSMGRDRFAQSPVGTGPFVLERWEMGARLIFRRNPRYWRSDYPHLDRIVLETGIAPHLQFMRFQRGDLDHVDSGGIITADHVWLQRNAAWRPYIENLPDIALWGVAMNTERPPWNNVHLRRAFAFAIDRESLCRSRNNRVRPIGGVYPPELPGYDPTLPGAQRFDPQRAREEMALAGHANGLPGEHLLWVIEGDAGMFYGQQLQADLRRVGINVRLRPASFAVFLENTERRGSAELSLSGWSQDFPDPSNFIDTLFHSRSIQAENSQNQAFYSNPRLDTLLDHARVELDPRRRIEMYRQAERIVVNDAPWAFLYYPVKTEVRQPYVRGYRPSPVWSHEFRPIWLDLPLRRFAARSSPFDGTESLFATLTAPGGWP